MRHHIQKQILDSLGHGDRLRYTDINQRNLEGNVFTYHVRQLVRDKLVIQNEDKSYSLTATGRAYLVHRYEDPTSSAHSIFLVVIRHQDRILLRRRLVQPLHSYSGFVHGEPTGDEDLIDTIRTRTRIKTGLEINDIKIHGSGLIRIYSEGELQSFSHAILASASPDNPNELLTHDDTGENFWIPENNLASQKLLLPSCLDLLNLTSKTSSEWFDLEY